MRVAASIISAFFLATGCGSQPAAAHLSPPAPTASAADSPLPVETPSPQLTPRQARIILAPRWVLVTNSLGDVSENLVVVIDSNIPLDFNGYLDNVVYKGRSIQADSVSFAIAMTSQAKQTYTLKFSGRAPAGSYQIWFDVPSYVDDVSRGVVGIQTQSYNAWVGGDQGPLLKGNPQAVRDDYHAAVLNLRGVVNISHK